MTAVARRAFGEPCLLLSGVRRPRRTKSCRRRSKCASRSESVSTRTAMIAVGSRTTKTCTRKRDDFPDWRAYGSTAGGVYTDKTEKPRGRKCVRPATNGLPRGIREIFENKYFYSIRGGNTVLAERSWKWRTRVTAERRRRPERKNTTDGRLSTNGADRPNERGSDDEGGGRGNAVVWHGRNFLRSVDLVSSPAVVVRRRSVGRHHNTAAKATAVTRYGHRAQRGCGDRDSWDWYEHNGNGARRNAQWL